MGLGEIFSLASALVWAFAVILFTRVGDRMPAFELNLSKNLIGLTLMLITVAVFQHDQWPDMSTALWIVVILSGIAGIGVADTLYLKALNTIGASTTGIVGALYSPFVVVISMFYLGESLHIGQVLGLILVLSGVVAISSDKPQEHHSLRTTLIGIAFGVAAMFLTAGSVVVVKPIIEEQPFFWITAIRLMAGVVGMLLYRAVQGKITATVLELRKPHAWGAIVLSSFLGAYLAMTLWLAGYRYTDASIAAILNESTAIFIVVLAYFFLDEKLSRKKLLGITLATAGVICVVL